ncbi:lytic transglycosylase domain-containing protein [Ostreiculturibacter nitratireducens]|uniref:lytic transglycosylase domain-containing protein n=1 Tax=Ostreiculturibacter nitratireducens TaxID=3075226 RepID=UPI0031B58B9D
MFRRLVLAISVAFMPFMARAEDPEALARAMKAVASKDWPAAVAQGRASGAIAADIVEWHRLRAGEGTFAEYDAFLARRPDWPGLPLLRKKGETSLTGQISSDRVIAYFAPMAPQTGEGALALAAAYRAQGETAKAEAALVRAWRELSLTPEEEAAFLASSPELLKDHHGGRIAAMLEAGLLLDAKRMLPLVTEGTRAVAAARIGLQEQANGVDALIAAVPERMMGSAGLAYDRFRWRIRKDRYDEASDLLLERSENLESLGDPMTWADWRRALARREMRVGDPRKAYRMASRHGLTQGFDYADLEWLSGFIALRKLSDAETALTHFRRFKAAVSGPISLSRAGYWEGRALEALKRPEEARAAYAEAARYQTAFYGLLAAERAGIPLDPALAGNESYPDWRTASFTGSSVFQAAVLLKAAGEIDLSERFFLHLSESLSGQEIGALAGLALEWHEANMALLLAKAAAEKGAIWPRAYFPVNGLEKLDLPVTRELALSIARRESEFDHKVVSGAGAKGLMQLMPGTAKMMAPKIGEGFSEARLTTDPGYNVRLGSAYLAELVAEFGTSPLLVASGYNAGPGRPRRWIEELGDPRDPNVDAVDWIEQIPFRETQTYVMRVAESLPIYRARLTGKVGPVRLSEELKGR